VSLQEIFSCALTRWFYYPSNPDYAFGTRKVSNSGGQRISLTRQLAEQAGVEADDARFEFLDMPQQFVENEHMTRP
jgi:hypothetical protein